ncbi:MAG: hypothetical protein DMF68_08095 [Acidobacteria bacterium]|nr:MAG: hypothetical protein DMF68_08095 [Acidobacteriota bacterium]
MRYVAIGEIHQLRLQLFSIDGTAVYDSDFRLGNLIDWKLQDQQGQRLSDGRYLFLITVKDFSDTLTQKYGTTQIEQEQVTLEQSSLDELSPAQATTLKSNQQATLLTAIDRIGAAGLSRIATESDDGTPSLDASMLGKKSNSAKQTTSGGQNLTGTGSMNQVAKWTDDNATLGNSSITDIGGKVGIGNSGPTATLSLGAPGVNALPTGTNIWISGVGIGPSLALQNRISFGVDTNQDYGGFMGVINNDGTAPGIALSFGTRGAGFDFSGMSVRAGRVGIGNNNPTALLSVGASGVNTLPQNTQLWLTGAGGAPSPSILQNRISLGVDTNQDYGGFMGVLNANQRQSRVKYDRN